MRTVGSGAFEIAVQRIAGVRARPEFALNEAPAPLRLAPDAMALTLEPADPADDSLTGRFVLLHDPDGADEWDGPFRAVVFARASVELDLLADPMLRDVAWTWLLEALRDQGAEYVQLGGTVTTSSGESFGTMETRPADGFVEVRASWTPAGAPAPETALERHVEAWLALAAQAAGLTPQAPSGASLARRRRTSV